MGYFYRGIEIWGIFIEVYWEETSLTLNDRSQHLILFQVFLDRCLESQFIERDSQAICIPVRPSSR